MVNSYVIHKKKRLDGSKDHYTACRNDRAYSKNIKLHPSLARKTISPPGNNRAPLSKQKEYQHAKQRHPEVKKRIDEKRVLAHVKPARPGTVCTQHAGNSPERAQNSYKW